MTGVGLHKLIYSKYLRDSTSTQYARKIQFKPSLSENDGDLQWEKNLCNQQWKCNMFIIVFNPLPKSKQ